MKEIIGLFIIEIGGRPKSLIEDAVKKVDTNLKEEKEFKVIENKIDSVEFNEEKQMFFGLIETKIKFNDINKIFNFMLDYTPTSCEIIEPSDLKIDLNSFNNFLNEMGGNFLTLQNEVRTLRAHIHNLQKENKKD